MTRIVVVESDGAGGMIHYAYQMCTALAASGADVTLVTSTYYELAELPHTFEVLPMMRLWPITGPSVLPSGVPRFVAPLYRKIRRLWRGLLFARAWSRTIGYLLAERPDVAQFGAIRFPFQAHHLRRLRRAGITLAQVCHEFEPREAGPLRQRMIRRLSTGLYRCFDVIFLHARETAERLVSHFPVDRDTIRIIPHGNEAMFVTSLDAGGDLRAGYRIPPTRPVVVFFGGLRPSKGLPDLIDAFAMVSAELDAHLIVAGPPAGVDPEALREQAVALGIGDRVVIDDRYLPMCEIGPLMRSATVVALPYRTATASGVLQVAYAFRVPVVATDTGGNPELIVDGKNGFLTPVADAEKIASAILKLLIRERALEIAGQNCELIHLILR